MKRRQALKILKESSRLWPAYVRPREAFERGLMPWRWDTWTRAHRIIFSHVRRELHARVGNAMVVVATTGVVSVRIPFSFRESEHAGLAR